MDEHPPADAPETYAVLRDDPDPDAPPQARVTGRVPVEHLFCDRGKVLDLSAGGLSLVRRFRMRTPKDGGPLAVVLSDGERTIQLACRVARESKESAFRWVYGIAFDALEPDIRRGLAEIANACRQRRSIVEEDGPAVGRAA